jgi:hypothetical protein
VRPDVEEDTHGVHLSVLLGSATSAGTPCREFHSAGWRPQRSFAPQG